MASALIKVAILPYTLFTIAGPALNGLLKLIFYNVLIELAMINYYLLLIVKYIVINSWL